MARVTRIVGVYHADGSLAGELRYVVGKLLGTAHCALCDITHAGVRRKRSFDACRAGLPVPFDALHLDERGPELRAFTDGRTPCVVASTSEGFVMVLDAAALDACRGDVARFETALRTALTARALDLPAGGAR